MKLRSDQKPLPKMKDALDEEKETVPVKKRKKHQATRGELAIGPIMLVVSLVISYLVVMLNR